MKTMIAAAVTLSALTLGACATGPERPAPPPFDEQARFSVDAPRTTTSRADTTPWWRQAVGERHWAAMERSLGGNPRDQPRQPLRHRTARSYFQARRNRRGTGRRA